MFPMWIWNVNLQYEEALITSPQSRPLFPGVVCNMKSICGYQCFQCEFAMWIAIWRNTYYITTVLPLFPGAVCNMRFEVWQTAGRQTSPSCHRLNPPVKLLHGLSTFYLPPSLPTKLKSVNFHLSLCQGGGGLSEKLGLRSAIYLTVAEYDSVVAKNKRRNKWDTLGIGADCVLRHWETLRPGETGEQ